MKKENNYPKHSTDLYEAAHDEETLYAASTHDCTGLTPTPAKNEFEAESYQQLFHFIPPYGPPINSCSAVDDPIPPYNYGPNSARNTHKTDISSKSRHDYP